MFTLVIGDKHLSSWSLRPWILLRHLGLSFSEVPLKLDTPGFAAAVRKYSAAERVPVLIDGDCPVWDSLAIIEYANEKVDGRAWPRDVLARAHARSISAEMHSGFQALRQQWPMKAASRGLDVPLNADGQKDVSRIDAIWQDCRQRYGAAGPWLFGAYSAADAMYAPVVLRFISYGARVSAVSDAYVREALGDAHMQQWIDDARAELPQ